MNIILERTATEYSYKNFRKENLRFTAPKPGEAKDDPTIRYIEIFIEYNYGVDGREDFRPFMLEGPIEHLPYAPKESSYDGDKKKEGQPQNPDAGGKKEKPYSVMSILDTANPEHLAYMAVYQEFYVELSLYIVTLGQAAGYAVYGIKPEREFISKEFNYLQNCTGIKHPISPKKQDKKIVPGPPRIYYKVNPFGPYRTMYTDYSNPPREMLKSVIEASETYGYCLSSLHRVYIGGEPQKPNIAVQQWLKSVVVDHFAPKGRSHLQTATIQRMQAAGNEKLNELEGQIAHIMRLIEESKGEGKKKEENPAQGSGPQPNIGEGNGDTSVKTGATNSGLVPTDFNPPPTPSPPAPSIPSGPAAGFGFGTGLGDPNLTNPYPGPQSQQQFQQAANPQFQQPYPPHPGMLSGANPSMGTSQSQLGQPQPQPGATMFQLGPQQVNQFRNMGQTHQIENIQ